MTALLLLCVVLFVAGPLKILPAIVVGVLLLGIAVFASSRISSRRETAAARIVTVEVAPAATVGVLGQLTAADTVAPRDHLLAGLGGDHSLAA